MPPVLSGPLAPGAVIGILGGGQLGRMSALAAARLGYRCHIYCPEPEAPAAQVTDLATVAVYDDEAAFQAHLETPHLKVFRDAIGSLIEDRRVDMFDVDENASA